MKPQRPTETDLLALVQSGFQNQLPKDRQAQAPPLTTPGASEKSSDLALPPPVPMVRITLAIPEDLRYRLQLTLMQHRRTQRSRITQDEYCTLAIAAQLDQEQVQKEAKRPENPLATFLKECLSDKALTRGWAPKAKKLLEDLGHPSS